MLLSLPVSGEVFKFVDRNGVTSYGDRRPVGRSYRILKLDCIHEGRGCPGGKPVNWWAVPLYRSQFGREIRLAAQTYGVDESLIRAVIHAESSFNPKAVSGKGARGLMQLMPATLQQYGVQNPYTAGDNINAGVKHLSELIAQYSGNERLACAAYHAGSGAVRRYGGVPPFKTTETYLSRIKILRQRYAS